MLDASQSSNGEQEKPKQLLGPRYEVLRRLTQKSRRITLLARDLQTQTLVIIKLLSLTSELQQEELRLFEQEAELLQVLSHPAIPQYLDHFKLNLQSGPVFAIVQTYIPAKTLLASIQEGRSFSETELKQIAKALLEVLIYLHRRRPVVIHRDIKPENILLVETPAGGVGPVYLIDFGAVEHPLSQARSSAESSSAIGTYGYMAPEHLAGRALPASDLFSLGMTLITLATATHPAKLPRKNLRIQFESVVQFSPAFTDWLKWMTEPGLEHRLTSAQEALRALEQEQPRNFTPAVIFQRPSGSKVLLHKGGCWLEISIPPVGFNPLVQSMGLVAIALNLGSLAAFAIACYAFASLRLPILCLVLPIWLVSFGVLFVLLFTLLGRVRLRITQQQIALTYELFKWKVNYPQPASIKHISKLKYIKPTNGNHPRIHPHLIIVAKTKQYKLGPNLLFQLAEASRLTSDPTGFGTLTEPELDWLANELSNWLGLPINVQ